MEQRIRCPWARDPSPPSSPEEDPRFEGRGPRLERGCAVRYGYCGGGVREGVWPGGLRPRRVPFSGEVGSDIHGQSTSGAPPASRPWIPYPMVPYSAVSNACSACGS
eukprot:8771988-Pyramimonas_sp.AAC.1